MMTKLQTFYVGLVLLFGVLVADPSLAFGRSIGALWFLALVVAVALSVSLGSLLWSAAKDSVYPKASVGVSAAVVGALALLIGIGSFMALDKDFGIRQDLTMAKIEYFCVDKFKGKECIRLVTGNPEAALAVPKWKRNQAVAKLKAFSHSR